jgi:hypothetical protein
MMIISHLYLFHCSRMHRTVTRAESICRREYERKKLWWDEEEFCDSELLHLHWLLKSSLCLKYSAPSFRHCNFWEEVRPINDTSVFAPSILEGHMRPMNYHSYHVIWSWNWRCRCAGCAWKLLLGICLQNWAVSEHENPMTTILRSANCMRTGCIIVQVRDLFQPSRPGHLGILFLLFSAARPGFDMSPSALRQSQVSSIRNYCLINIFLVSFIYVPHYMMASFYCSKHHMYTVHGQ